MIGSLRLSIGELERREEEIIIVTILAAGGRVSFPALIPDLIHQGDSLPMAVASDLIPRVVASLLEVWVEALEVPEAADDRFDK